MYQDQFGEHSYVYTEYNGEMLLQVSGVKFQLSDSVKHNIGKLHKIIKGYGVRAELAANSDGVDFKAISHCIRVLFEVEELLKNAHINFPMNEPFTFKGQQMTTRDFVKGVKYNTLGATYDEIMDWINNELNVVTHLVETSKLPEVANYKFINKFIINTYEKYVINV